MAYPTAAGVPSYSGTFVPEIWSGKLLKNFYDATVLSGISNTDYQGEISAKGDKVIIRTTPTITIRDYTEGMNLQIERPESPNVELLIDKGKYFNTILGDVSKIQSDMNLMDIWSKDASERMKIAIDQDVLTNIPSQVSADNKGATAGVLSNNINLGDTGAPVQLTKSNIIDYILDLGQVLDEQNQPDDGRWIVLPAWAFKLLKQSDIKDASLTGDGTSVLRNGRVGMLDRFTLYYSNNVYSVTDTGHTAYSILAGHKYGLAFASQLTDVETLRAESTFGTLMRGLQIYGYKAVKPECLARLYAYQ